MKKDWSTSSAQGPETLNSLLSGRRCVRRADVTFLMTV
jgi:hypothetical protein